MGVFWYFTLKQVGSGSRFGPSMDKTQTRPGPVSGVFFFKPIPNPIIYRAG